MKIRIEPYKTWSGGARALGERAGILRATPRQVRKHGDFDVVINWGRSERRFNGEYLNSPDAVARASNKLTACQAFAESEVPQPPYTVDRDVAQQWLADGDTVVARTLLRANSGRGIVVVPPDTDQELPRAPLYTKYLKKADEYRVHVFDGAVIDVQQKRKRQEVDNDDVDYQIRNACNGWVFCRGGVDAPVPVRDAAVAAVAALGLDFGAADVGFNTHYQTAAVYEVNTAPGLEGSTLDSYYTALRARYAVLDRGAYARRRQAA